MITEPVEPESPKLEPVEFVAGREVETEFWFDGIAIGVELNRVGLDHTVKLTGELSLDELAELYDKIIAPALAYRAAFRQYRADDAAYRAEQTRLHLEQRDAERARQEAEATFRVVERSQSAGFVSRTVHRRACASLAAARQAQTLGTVIFWATPENVTRHLFAALDGGSPLRFCQRCKPIAETAAHNRTLVTAHKYPGQFGMERTKETIEGLLWEAHHAALNARRDEG